MLPLQCVFLDVLILLCIFMHYGMSVSKTVWFVFYYVHVLSFLSFHGCGLFLYMLGIVKAGSVVTFDGVYMFCKSCLQCLSVLFCVFTGVVIAF
jgi:hypothetical protein